MFKPKCWADIWLEPLNATVWRQQNHAGGGRLYGTKKIFEALFALFEAGVAQAKTPLHAVTNLPPPTSLDGCWLQVVGLDPIHEARHAPGVKGHQQHGNCQHACGHTGQVVQIVDGGCVDVNAQHQTDQTTGQHKGDKDDQAPDHVRKFSPSSVAVNGKPDAVR